MNSMELKSIGACGRAKGAVRGGDSLNSPGRCAQEGPCAYGSMCEICHPFAVTRAVEALLDEGEALTRTVRASPPRSGPSAGIGSWREAIRQAANRAQRSAVRAA